MVVNITEMQAWVKLSKCSHSILAKQKSLSPILHKDNQDEAAVKSGKNKCRWVVMFNSLPSHLSNKFKMLTMSARSSTEFFGA